MDREILEHPILILLLFVVLIVVPIIRFINIRKIKIATKKGIVDFMSFIIFVVGVIGITAASEDIIIACVFDGLAIFLFLSIFFHQGIFDDGIMVNTKRRLTYNWDEIEKIDIIRKKDVKVTYFPKSGMSRALKFSLYKYDDIVDILVKNEVQHTIKYD